ncbi:MAG: SNF2-related protein [Thiolinea sp.]
MSVINDLFLFDSEQLHAIASSEHVREGLLWYKENRVTDVHTEETHLMGYVEAPDSDDPYSCEMYYDGDGVMKVRCDCGANEDNVCPHMIATLYTHAARTGEQALMSATENALAWREKRGRTEVEVEPVTDGAVFGAWKTASITSDKFFSHSYRVNIRSLLHRNNYCTCPDFATNQLGTCKHIEGVLNKLHKRSDFDDLAQRGAPTPYIFLNWEGEQAPLISLQRTSTMTAGLNHSLAPYFNAAGHFTGQLPDDFFRLTEQLRDRTDIETGEDAISYARQLSSRASQKLRAQDIHAQISSSDGHLPGIKARLYPYQVEGVAFLAANGRALLADDMGLGKTLQAIAAASWLLKHAQAKRILVVCPASLKQQWAREIEKFTEHSTQIIQGSPEARGVQYRQGDGFYIMNYELVLRDLSVINSTLSPDLIILDEAQRIKNWQTKIATAVKRIESRYAFVLSGTPLENRLEDLYSLMQVVDPNVLGPLWRYHADFHIKDERGKVLGYRNLSTLRQRLTPIMLRRDRRLVSDQLPQRIEQRLDLPLTEAQQELHDDALQTAGRLAHKAKRRPLTPSEQNRMMASLQAARMACNAAGLIDKETEGSPKLDELENIATELCIQSGLKMVVFSQWEMMTQMVEQRLRKLNIGCVRLHGGVPTAKRGALMDRFRDDDAIQAFISTDAGGTGLNLQNASVLVNLDMPWNPAVLDQRIARVHRLGQRATVQTILMVASPSYEEHVMGLVKGKRHLFDNVIDPDASEDVVGVSKKLLETLSDDLEKMGIVEDAEQRAQDSDAGKEAPDLPEVHDESTDDSAETIKPKPSGPSEYDLELENRLRHCIVQLQELFGSRIERVLGSGGGLLVILDQATTRDDWQLEEHNLGVPVALLDPRTLRSLQKLGDNSPLKEASPLYDVAEEPAEPQISRLQQLAQEKLQAAEVLMEQGIFSVTLNMLVNALLQAAAAKAELAHAPAENEAAIWLYGEAIPNGWLDQEQAGLISQALALAQTPDVPLAMLEGLLNDTRQFING